MRKIVFFPILLLWIVFASLALTFFWSHYPEFAPFLSERQWFWLLSNMPGFWDGEAGHDLELIFYLSLAFAVVTLVTVMGIYVQRRRKDPKLR